MEDCSDGILLNKDFTTLVPFEFIAWRRCVFFLLTVGVDKRLVKEFSMENDLAGDEGGSIMGEGMLLTRASTFVAVSKFGAFSSSSAAGSGISVMSLGAKASSGMMVGSKGKIPVA